MPDLQPPVPDEVLHDLLRALGRSSSRARREIADALADGIDGLGWATATSILDELVEGIAAQAGGGLLAAALAGAWRVGEGLPAEYSSPSDAPPPAPAPALVARIREQVERTHADLRPLLLESLPPELARAVAPPPAGRPEASDADMAAITSVVQPTPVQLPLVEHAVAELRARRLVRHEDLRAMAATARLKALAVAGLVRREALGTLSGLLRAQVAAGPDLPEFKRAVREEIGSDAFLSPRHLETTFRQAVQEAYARGSERLLENSDVGDQFPFVETLPIRDSRLTTLCAECSRAGIGGTAIYRRDDPTWARIKNPRHWGCRCGTNYLTLRMAARAGIEEAQDWLRTGTPPARPAWVPMPEVALKAGL